MARNDINVTVEDNNTLVISGERVKEDRQDDDRVHRYERVVGRFLRRFRSVLTTWLIVSNHFRKSFGQWLATQ